MTRSLRVFVFFFVLTYYSPLQGKLMAVILRQQRVLQQRAMFKWW